MARPNGLPPGRSQYDGTVDVQTSDSIKVNSVPAAQEVEVASRALKEMNNVARADHQRIDLKDLLANSSRDSQYPELPAGWPAVLSQEASITRPMPDMVIDSQRQMQAACFCGVFPEIEHAWASVDNVLYVWDTSRMSVPVKWQEEQAICCAGLSRPKPNVFQQAVQYLLVVCTTVEIALVGVHLSRDANGNAEMKLVNLEHFRAPSDDVMMTTTTSTPEGRIFLGGNDSHLYELEYRNQSSWLRGRCNKMCYTGTFAAYLPRWTVFRRASPIMQIIIDRDRQILYTRSQAGAIMMFDMGVSGVGPVRKLSEMTNVMPSADKGQSPAGSTIVLIAPIPPSESSAIHLMAVTADGRRVYLSSQPVNAPPAPVTKRPLALYNVTSRSAITPPAHQGQSRSLNVTVAHYSQGALLLADTISEGNSRVLLVGRDLTIPPVGTSTGSGPGLREFVCEISPPTAGEVLAFGLCPQAKPLLPVIDNTIKSELATQHVTPAQHFMVMTTAGATQAHRLRPVDVLTKILREDRPGKLEEFFSLFGATEASAMCYAVATSPAQEASSAIVDRARAALLDTRLTGEAALPSGHQAGASHPAAQGGFYMGEVVAEANKPEWSGGHRGLQTYLQRLLHPTWDSRLVSPTKANPNSLMPNLNEETLKALQLRLRDLSSFLQDYQQRKLEQLRKARAKPASYFGRVGLGGGFGQTDSKGRANPPAKRQRLDDPQAQEADKVQEVTALVSRASEACFLVRVLIANQLSRLTQLIDDSWRKRLQNMSLKDLVCSKDGEETMTQIIAVLLDEHQKAAGLEDSSLSSRLQQGCPSYFKEDDKLYHTANGELRRAQTLQGTARQDITRSALDKLVRVAKTVDINHVSPLLAQLGAYDGMVTLALAKAKALDPEVVAAQKSEAGRLARERRNEECYAPIIQILKYLVNPDLKEGSGSALAVQGGLPAAAVDEAKAGILRRGASCTDNFFLEQLLAGLVSARAISELINLSQAPGMFSKVQKHLLKAGGLPTDIKPSLSITLPPLVALDTQQVISLEMLAKIYTHAENGDCLEAAAAVYNALAMRMNGPNTNAVDLEKRLDLFRQAALQGQALGNGSIISAMETNVQLMDIQIRLVHELTALQASSNLPEGAPDDLGLRLKSLQGAPQPLVDLFNQYAVPYHQWELCIELVHASDGVDMAYVQQLWDLHLKQGYELPGLQSLDAKRNEAFARVQRVTSSCYPSDTALPLDHVLLRLEQMSSGVWPHRHGTPLEDHGGVADNVVKACKDEPGVVQEAYNALLDRPGGDQNNPDVRAPILRMRVLKSLYCVLLARQSKLHEQRSYGSYQTYKATERRVVSAVLP
ncbi:TPA: hypothetical protein ACH3X2_004613 [Trebouxia sp. C0005]